MSGVIFGSHFFFFCDDRDFETEPMASLITVLFKLPDFVLILDEVEEVLDLVGEVLVLGRNFPDDASRPTLNVVFLDDFLELLEDDTPLTAFATAVFLRVPDLVLDTDVVFLVVI